MRAFVYGGAACGKSAFAEELCCGRAGQVLYVATMERGGADAEARIERHRRLRAGKGFSVLECPRCLASAAIPAADVALVEDAGNLVANELFAGGATGDHDLDADRAARRVLAGIEHLALCVRDLVVVSVDVARDGVGYDEGTQAYLKALAQVNAELAIASDCAVEVVCGLPVWLRGCEELWKEGAR
ncbi:bifunctional adenosylcobinamide kinase/adenosylcobinamide-phosphate guanylyltransferase [Collinsella tanakaei]|uniref:bifunctional adenosylcobinamide kinase/adenosylcobinamide-phosphate guanylyltransferase n=1 Tax=Collinsella tanakaei TaxID=626935 RepID=UPI0025A44167|nr:bifunctional adenosylcobinamide kinase/adenosylcobinamide-phosphate guanylyltransferase [Collinsella tanakaei]MDM8245735.1 bifunctional adenosylcobinamide kinase/adenosylcobinamide-phosphate guanylyltransferase [Collinsella tanakaei]